MNKSSGGTELLIANVTRSHFFWSGLGSLDIAVSGWQKRIRKLLRIAGVKGHPHLFRDSFATELLPAGVPTERVSILLGHLRGSYAKKTMLLID